jgi:hypothetical protein
MNRSTIAFARGARAGIRMMRMSAPAKTASNAVGAYETPIDKMLSVPPQRGILELMPDEGAQPRPDGP